jgi:hypothetical protein
MGIATLLEQVRLRAHFRQVLAELKARDVSHLATPERSMRERLVLELARYARAGVFPRNRDFTDRRMPYFIDASGTRCAVAHLVEATGEREYVEHVRRTRNNARVRELASDRALQAWLRGAGFTVAEAARIQPSYCFVSKADVCFCNLTSSGPGVVIATTTEQVGNGVTARVDSLHGETGAIAIGESITVQTNSGAHPGDPLLVSVGFQGTMPYFGFALRLDGDEVILNNCEHDVPVLSKSDAIAALLADDGAGTGCSMHLASVDDTWGESQCDDDGPGGCAIGGPASPLVIGAALAAALFTRRSGRVRAAPRTP